MEMVMLMKRFVNFGNICCTNVKWRIMCGSGNQAAAAVAFYVCLLLSCPVMPVYIDITYIYTYHIPSSHPWPDP